MSNPRDTNSRWHMLALATATHTFAAAMPLSCMPPLFKEISGELGLSLVQIGTIWGLVNLASVFTTIVGGWLGDVLGVKRLLIVTSLLVGVTGALRGLSSDFVGLAVTSFAFGLVRSMIPVNVHRTVGMWFTGRNFGMANGAVSIGMGFGLALGPAISATYLSPLLGGWRNVVFLYGAASMVIGLLWYAFGKEPEHMSSVRADRGRLPLGKAVSELMRHRGLWVQGISLTFRMGCMQGLTGYLPLYLRGQGWTGPSADASLSLLYGVSVLSVMPLSMLSDRLGSRKAILFPAILTALSSVALLYVAGGFTVWVVVALVGVFWDSFMGIFLTMTQETRGVRSGHSGMALGLVMSISGIGAFISPPVGNSLASISPSLPFLFWASLCIVPLVGLFFIADTGRRTE